MIILALQAPPDNCLESGSTEILREYYFSKSGEMAKGASFLAYVLVVSMK